MKSCRLIGVLALLACLAPTARAEGPWRTFLRPQLFTDLLAEGDTLWCASRDGGLWRFTPSDRAFTSFAREPGKLVSNQLLALAMDARRRLWVGTLGRGLSVLNADRARWDLVNVFDGLPSDTVNVIESQGDTLWIGTPSGLALWDGDQIVGRLPDGINPSPFANSDIRGIARVGDSLWVGTPSGAYVSRLSQGLPTWTPVVAGLKLAPVQALATDGVSLFAMARDSVHILDGAAGRWVVLTGIGTARALSHDRGHAYASMSGGVYAWNGSRWTLLNGALRTSERFVLTRDAAGRTWAAGRPATAVDQRETGLYGQVAGGPWEFFFPPGPPGNDILNIEVAGSRVYVTTTNTGVGRLDETGWTHWFQSPQPSTSLTTFRRPVFTYAAIADPLGRVWFGSWAPVDFGSNCATDTGAVEIMQDFGDSQQFTRNLYAGVSDGLHSFTRGATVGRDSVVFFALDSPCIELYPSLGIDYYAPDGTLRGTLGAGPGLLPSSQVWTLATGRDGRLWAGTSKGLVHFRHDAAGIRDVREVTEANVFVVRGLATYGDSLWVLTTTGGLRRYSTVNPFGAEFLGDYETLGPPASQSVRPLDVAANGAVWVGTANGLRVHRTRTEYEDFTIANSPLAGDDVRSVRVDRATGYVWVATSGGLSRFDPGYVPTVPTVPALEIDVYPNPVRLSALGIGLRLAGNATQYQGQIIDLGGRIVQRFRTRASGAVIWDGRDTSGNLVRPGIYFLRVEAGGRTGAARVVVVR